MDKASVLIVEDESIVAFNLQRALTRLGYDVPAFVANGEDAVRTAQRTRPDAVLMDIRLQGDLDGIGAAEQLAAHSIPVLFVTSHSDDETLERARATRPYGFLVKPVQERELHAALQMVIERRRLESALDEQRSRIEGIVNSAMDGIITIDADQRIVLFNEAAAAMFACPADAAIGRTLDDFIPAAKRALHREQVRSFAESGLSARTMGRFGEVRGVRATGEEFPLEACISRVEVGRSRLLTVTLRDITEKKRASRERATLEAQLRQTQKMEALGRLTGGIAHDFNNIISVVLGQASLAQRQLAEGRPVERNIQGIMNACERAAALTQKLLAYGRAQIPKNEILDLNAVVESSAELIRCVIPESITLTLNLARDAGHIRADRAELEQVLMNLSINGRDAMPSGGRLVIATARAGDGHVVLSVADSGVGMDAETQQHAFEPFFTTKGEQGAGLGLSTVYGIVTAAGGTISLDSEIGKGCRVQVALPRLDPPPSDVAPGPSERTRGPATVMVVEDQKMLRELIGETLEAYGYRTLLADSGEAALALLDDTQQQVDLLLTDIVMPGMNGVELGGRATILRPALRVLYMSGYAPQPKHRELFSTERAAFLQKPFAPDELLAKLNQLLAS